MAEYGKINHDYPQALRDYGGDILLAGISYDAKSKKHPCKIEEYIKIREGING